MEEIAEAITEQEPVTSVEAAENENENAKLSDDDSDSDVSEEKFDDGRSERVESPKACSGWEHDITFVDMLPQQFDVAGMYKRTKALAIFQTAPSKDSSYVRVGIHGTSQATRDCRRELVNLGALDVGRDPFAPGLGQLHIPLFRDMHGQWLNFCLPLPLMDRVQKRHDEIENAFCVKMRCRSHLPVEQLGVVFLQGCLRDVVNAKKRIVCLCHLPILKVNPPDLQKWQEHKGVAIVDAGPSSPIPRVHFMSAPLAEDDAASDSSYEAPLNRKPLVLRPRPESPINDETPKAKSPIREDRKGQGRDKRGTRDRTPKRRRDSRRRQRSRDRSRNRGRNRSRGRERTRSRDRRERGRNRSREGVRARSRDHDVNRSPFNGDARRRGSTDEAKWPRGQMIDDSPAPRRARAFRDPSQNALEEAPRRRPKVVLRSPSRRGMRGYAESPFGRPEKRSHKRAPIALLCASRKKKAAVEIDSDVLESEREQIVLRKRKKIVGEKMAISPKKKKKKKREFSESDLHSPKPVRRTKKKKQREIDSPSQPKRRKVAPVDSEEEPRSPALQLRKKKKRTAEDNVLVMRTKRQRMAQLIGAKEIEHPYLEAELVESKKQRRRARANLV